MNQIVNKLPENYRPFVMARLESQMKHLKPNEVKFGIAKILSQASFDMGSPMSSDKIILTYQTEACFKELNFKYSTLTLSELRNAFKMGIRGEFGQFFGMCPKTYHQFIKGYFELPERYKAQEVYLQLIGESNNMPVDKSAKSNPEGQKKVVEILKQFVTKPDYSPKSLELKPKPPIIKSERDKFIQACFMEFEKLDKIDGAGRFAIFEGKEVDCAEYAEIRLKQYDELRDKFIQQCFRDFTDLVKNGGFGLGEKFIMFEGKEVDEAEYTKIRLKKYDESA